MSSFLKSTQILISSYFERRSYLKVILKAFPEELKNDVKIVFEHLSFSQQFNTRHVVTLKVNNQIVVIPCRIYLNTSTEATYKILNPIQKNILNSIYLLSANGYTREMCLRNIDGKYSQWMIPYIIKLLGEPVYEILLELDKQISAENSLYFVNFINDNSDYWNTIQSRVISYWNEYYRKEFPDLKLYVGYCIIQKINHFVTSSNVKRSIVK